MDANRRDTKGLMAGFSKFEMLSLLPPENLRKMR